MSSDESSIEERFVNLDLDKPEDKYINILLLGETGVGKSTFINALGNYFVWKYFEKAEENGVEVAIPAVFEITNKNNTTRTVKLGKTLEDDNECLETGESATQRVRTYVFRLWKGRVSVRLIDTPGLGDTRGIVKDEENCASILRYVKSLKKLHAICFLFKPTQSRETTFFKYCLHQMLSRFDKAACKNIFFLYTSTRGTDYTAGETNRILKKIVESIQDQSKDITLSIDKNFYCFDNEAFKYLAAVEKNIKFQDSLKEVYRNSWRVSAKNAHSLITQLQRGNPPPYLPDNLINIESVRNILFFCAKLLAAITQTIKDNSTMLDRLQTNRSREMKEIEEMSKSKIHVTDVEKTSLCNPVTVCTSSKCADVHWVNGEPKWHYKKVCHGCCIEVFDIKKEIVGCPQLLNCDVINQSTRNCNQCGCDYSIHMHVDYITRIKESSVLDSKTRDSIAEKESLLIVSEEIINDVVIKNKELQNEYEVIQKVACSCAEYLQNNAIVAFSSSFKDYVIYLMNQKGDSVPVSTLEVLKNLLNQYEEIEIIFKEAAKKPKQTVEIQYIEEQLKKLLDLTNNSEEIKDYIELRNLSCRHWVPVTDHYIQEKYFEEQHVKKGGRNQTRHNERRDDRQCHVNEDRNRNDRGHVNEDKNRNDRGHVNEDRNRNDRRHVNEDRNRNDRQRHVNEDRNRNDRQSNRNQNNHYQRGRSTERQDSRQNYAPQGAFGGISYPQNDPGYPPKPHTPYYSYPDHPYQAPPHYTPHHAPGPQPTARPDNRNSAGSSGQWARRSDRYRDQSRGGGRGKDYRGNRREGSTHRVGKTRYRKSDSRKVGGSGDESDESVASSK